MAMTKTAKAALANSFLRDFPDYDDLTLEGITLPDDAVNLSYRNDTCPSVGIESLKLQIYIDYKDADYRESYNAPRFNVYQGVNAEDVMFSTNDWSQVKALIKTCAYEKSKGNYPEFIEGELDYKADKSHGLLRDMEYGKNGELRGYLSNMILDGKQSGMDFVYDEDTNTLEIQNNNEILYLVKSNSDICIPQETDKPLIDVSFREDLHHLQNFLAEYAALQKGIKLEELPVIIENLHGNLTDEQEKKTDRLQKLLSGKGMSIEKLFAKAYAQAFTNGDMKNKEDIAAQSVYIGNLNGISDLTYLGQLSDRQIISLVKKISPEPNSDKEIKSIIMQAKRCENFKALQKEVQKEFGSTR